MSLEETGVTPDRIGDRLKEAREERDLTLNDVSKKLLVREDYLRAIEDMYASGVPKGYLNGILRSYAGFLGLPAEETVKTFAEQCGAISQAGERKVVVASNVSAPSRMRGMLMAAAAVFVVTGVAGVSMLALSQNETVAPVTVEAGSPVNGARESLFASANLGEVDAQLPLSLTAQTNAWLEVRGADGTIFRSRKMAAGEVYHPRIGAGWTVTARYGGAFVWHVGDVEIGPLGEGASPVYAMSVDAVAKDAREIASPAFAVIGDSKPTR